MIKKENIYKDFIVSTLASLLFILQIIFGFYLLSSISQIEYIAYIGVGLYIAAGVIFGIPDFHRSITLRLDQWYNILNGFFGAPLRGYGLGIFPWKDVHPSGDSVMYSSLFEFVMGVGVLGALWLGWTLNKFKQTFLLCTEGLAVLSLIILSTVEYPCEIPRLWITIVAVLAFYVIKLIDKKNGGIRLCSSSM